MAEYKGEIIPLPTESSESVAAQAGAFGKSVFESLGGAAGGAAGGYAGALGGAALGAMTGPFAPVAAPAFALAGAVGGGLTGGYLGSEAQRKAGEYIPESLKKSQGFDPAQREAERKEYPVTSFVGSITPDVVAAYPALRKILGVGVTSAKQLAEAILKSRTASQESKLSTQAKEAAETGAQKLEQEAQEAQQKIGSGEEKIRLAETVAEKASQQPSKSLRELAGVKTLPGETPFGGYQPIPQTAADIGKYIREQTENFVNSIKSQRNKAANENFTAAKSDAARKEAAGQFVNTTPIINYIDGLIAKGGSTDYLRSLTQLRNDLEATKAFEGLEVIRRRLGDAAFGMPEEGYKAIGQKFAKDMYGSLAKQMGQHSSQFSKYLDDYARLSKPLEVHGTKVGKGITETQDAAGRYYAKTAEQVSKDVFSSPEKYRQLVDAVGGNKQIAEAAARRHFANLMENAKTPETASKVLKDNRALLNEIPNIRQELMTKYVEPLASSKTKIAGVERFVEKEKIANEAIQGRLKNIEGSKTLFTDAMNTLSSAKPGKATEMFDTMVLPKIRNAEIKAGAKIIEESQIVKFREQVLELDRITDKAERQLLAAKIVAGLVGLTGLFGAGKATVEAVGGR